MKKIMAYYCSAGAFDLWQFYQDEQRKSPIILAHFVQNGLAIL